MRSPAARLAELVVALVALQLAGDATSAPPRAVVRLTSHGASGTVVSTGPGLTWVLTCAHAFQGPYRTRRIVVDAPAPRGGAARSGGIRLVRADDRLDLALVELRAGPLPFCCPIAPPGHRAGRLASVGYAGMRRPASVRIATPAGATINEQFTRERPAHGMSGGALVDVDAGALVGTTIGFETAPPGRGVYTSLRAIHAFLGTGNNGQFRGDRRRGGAGDRPGPGAAGGAKCALLDTGGTFPPHCFQWPNWRFVQCTNAQLSRSFWPLPW